jgi:hypothetical protein
MEDMDGLMDAKKSSRVVIALGMAIMMVRCSSNRNVKSADKTINDK